jgi:paraquat-inducible protein A
VNLAPGERALCAECGAFLAKGSRFGADAALAFAFTGVFLALPAMALPFITVSKLANERTGTLSSGVSALWTDSMWLTSAWVLVCGAIAPVLLLTTLVAILTPVRFGWRTAVPRQLTAMAHAIEHWSMPEVHVLAVLVALVKLHTLVGVQIGWGFWCYVAMSFMTLLAWRNFDLAASARLQPVTTP